MKAGKGNRWGQRDATMILVAYRHGLRASELPDLRRDPVDLTSATLHVRRLQQATPSTHPILGGELSLWAGYNASRSPNRPSCSPLNAARHSAPALIVERAGGKPKVAFKAHPHILRQSLRLCVGQ